MKTKKGALPCQEKRRKKTLETVITRQLEEAKKDKSIVLQALFTHALKTYKK